MWEALSQFDVLGTVERFDETILLAARVLNWSSADVLLPPSEMPPPPATVCPSNIAARSAQWAWCRDANNTPAEEAARVSAIACPNRTECEVLIRHVAPLDHEIYAHAQTQLLQAVAAHGPSFRADLRRRRVARRPRCRWRRMLAQQTAPPMFNSNQTCVKGEQAVMELVWGEQSRGSRGAPGQLTLISRVRQQKIRPLGRQALLSVTPTASSRRNQSFAASSAHLTVAQAPVHPRMAQATTAVASGLLLALGIISAPMYKDRRLAMRASWMTWPNTLDGNGSRITVRFVVRGQHTSQALGAALYSEQQQYGDMLVVAVPWNESRLRGPVLSLAAWLRHATRAYASARFIAKCDDDAYINAPQLERVLASVSAAEPMASGWLYLGVLKWFHWFPHIFERSGFGDSFYASLKAGEGCRNKTRAEESCKHAGCGACLGPFPFASGFLILLGGRLARALSRSPLLNEDVRRLRNAPGFARENGKPQYKVMEDIWLGSVLYRDPPPEPVMYVDLSSAEGVGLSVDRWGASSTRTAVVVHVKQKRLERFLAIHAFAQSAEYCPLARVKLSCMRGCGSFVTSWTLQQIASTRPEASMRFCNDSQNRAASCKLRATTSRRCCGRGTGKPCNKIIDLMQLATSQPITISSSAVMNGSRTLPTRFGFLANTNAYPFSFTHAPAHSPFSSA